MISVPVDDDSEIERSQAQQIGRNPREVHAHEGEQQGQRNRDRRQQRRAHAAQKQEQHRDHDHQAFQQGMADCVQRVVHQIRAIVNGDDPDAVRQARGVQLTHRMFDTVQRVFQTTISVIGWSP